MRNFILTRVGAMVLILIALTAVMFVLQHISPMDPVKAQLGANASAEAASRVAISGNLPSSPFQKLRTVSRNLSFHSAQPGGNPPT